MIGLYRKHSAQDCGLFDPMSQIITVIHQRSHAAKNTTKSHSLKSIEYILEVVKLKQLKGNKRDFGKNPRHELLFFYINGV